MSKYELEGGDGGRTMFTTGEFANLCETTRKTLYHYERIGLLAPTVVDDANNYRYYSENDYFRFFIINVLADAGFSLEQVASIVQKGDLQVTMGHIKSARAALEKEIKQLKLRNACLRELEGELATWGEAEIGKPALKERPDYRYPIVANRAQHQDELDSMGGFKEALDNMKKFFEGDLAMLLAPMGNSAPVRQFLDGNCSTSSDIVYDLLYLAPSVPITKKTASRIDVHLKPAGVYAEVYYTGPWGGILEAYDMLIAFLEEHELVPVDRFYEIPESALFDIEYNSRLRSIVSVRGVPVQALDGS